MVQTMKPTLQVRCAMRWCVALILAGTPPMCGRGAAAQNWAPAGFGGGGLFPQVAVDPADPRIVYLASDVSGLNKSTNYGESWFKIDSGLESREVAAFAVAPSEPLSLWAGTPLGLFASTNGGAAWSLRATNIVCYKHVDYRGITISQAGTILVAAHRLAAPAEPPESGDLIGELYRSPDGGRTWTLNTQLENQFASSYRRFPAVVFDAYKSGRAFLLVDGVGVLESTDDGRSWACFTNGLPAGLNWRNMDIGSNVIYATATPSLVYRSSKDAASWQLITNGVTEPEATDYPVADAIGVSPSDGQAVYLGQAGWPFVFYRSNDGGQHWNGSVVPDDYAFDTNNAPFQSWIDPLQAPVAMAVDPSDPSRIYYSTWWGLWRSDNAGTNWAEKVVGAQNTVCTAVLTDGQTLFSANMDVGILRSPGAGRTWLPCFPAPGQTDVELHAWALARGPDGTLYAGITMRTPTLPATPAVCRSEDGGTNWQVSAKGIFQTSAFDLEDPVSLAADPRTPGTLYLAVGSYTDHHAIHRSTDYGQTWTALPAAPGSADNTNDHRVKCIAVDPLATNRLFAGLYWDGFWYSEDRGAHWIRAHGTGVYLDYASVQQIVPLPDGRVFAAFDSGLYQSADHGRTFTPVLTNANWGEDSLQYACSVAFNSANTNDLFLSTAQIYPVWYNRGSVWRSRDGGATWSDITANLPVKPVVGLCCQAGYLYAATWGANVYRTSLQSPALPFRITGIALEAKGQVVIRWPSATDQFFTLLRATNLSSAFIPTLRHIPATPPANTRTLAAPSPGPEFYRVLVEP